MYELIFYHARNGQSEIEAHLDALAKEAQTRDAIRQTHWRGSLGASASEQPHLFLLLERQ